MQRTQRIVTIATLGLAAAAITMAVLNPVDTKPQVTGPIGAGSGLLNDPAGEYVNTEDTPDITPGRPVIILGDLDPVPDPTRTTK